MPKKVEVSVLYDSIDINVQAPATYEEADKLIGEVGGALNGFISDCVARNFLPRLYATVAKQLEGEGQPRQQIGSEKRKDKDVPIYETHIKHVGRVYNDGDDKVKAHIEDLLQKAADTIPFYEKGERGSGLGGKISQESLDTANQFFAQGDDVVETKVLVIEQTIPGYVVARDAENNVTVESLARGIQALGKYLTKQAKAKASSMLG